jgi:hypothetical protein
LPNICKGNTTPPFKTVIQSEQASDESPDYNVHTQSGTPPRTPRRTSLQLNALLPRKEIHRSHIPLHHPPLWMTDRLVSSAHAINLKHHPSVKTVIQSGQSERIIM